MIRILIADDHPIVRAGVVALVNTEPDLSIVAEAATAEEAVTLANELQPDVVLMDLQFGTQRIQGADATKLIRTGPDASRVLVLTNYDTDADILSAVEAGASGYLLKDAPPTELLDAIRAAAAGKSALAPAIATRLVRHVNSPSTQLSPREVEVLERVASGATNKQIGAELFLSEATVKSHLVHIFTKLGVSSRTQAVAKARESGLIRA
ncbi:response regulator [Lysinibacter cavernae]|uniref:DNA-binding NarL/FixJ family response regulator n=1 Tax=Lysinibacter cavernae TaxID=1640652 RepID=A0A7X5QZA7_9MICO|nr:response regulator transcription factor [Lysinibacter cavernae]NIH52769.1 DNA-binding NarL/FixJ family response regulator [Lysinibacter cavernae]